MTKPRITILSRTFALMVATLVTTSFSYADTFGTGTNQFIINFSRIGNPGNVPDSNGYGAVAYTYQIGTYDISANQFNAAIASGLSNVTAGYWSNNQPVANVTWYKAAAFVNWLDISSGYAPAYNLTSSNSLSLWATNSPGYNPSDAYRNSLAKYFLPSENEWYKSAYYSWQTQTYNLYPTGTTVPTPVASGTATNTAVYNQSFTNGPSSIYTAGGLSPYGTMGQAGNVQQWLESAWSNSNTNTSTTTGAHSTAGYYYDQSSSDLSSADWAFSQSTQVVLDYSSSILGFRVASSVDEVPEPSTLYLIVMVGLASVIVHRYRRRKSSRELT